MKKLFTLALIAVVFTSNAYSTLEDFCKGHNFMTYEESDLEKYLNFYVGSQKYKYLVGGLYKKGNIVGAVLYVDDVKGTMILYTVTQDKFIPEGEEPTYKNIKAAYKRNGWHLFNEERTGYYLCKNQHTMLYQRNWKDTKDYKLYIPYATPLDCSDNGAWVDIFYVFHSDFKVSYSARCYDYREYETINGVETLVKQEIVYLNFDHAGWYEVPLEPQYVSGYLGQ